MSLLSIDTNLTETIYRFGSSSPTLQFVSYSAAAIFVYGLPLVLLFLFFKGHQNRLASLKIFLMAIFSWKVVSNFIGIYFYSTYGFRDRPFSLLGLKELFLEQPQKAFPSDHATLLVAVTLGFFAYRYPKLGWLFVAGTLVSSIGRVLVGFHFVGDILAGWLLGILTFMLFRLFDGPLTKLIESILKIFRHGSANGDAKIST